MNLGDGSEINYTRLLVASGSKLVEFVITVTTGYNL